MSSIIDGSWKVVGLAAGVGVLLGYQLRKLTKDACEKEIVESSAASEEFKLFYWPDCTGRGEFMRLMFAETETPFEEVNKNTSLEEVYRTSHGPPVGRDFFAIPVLQHGEIRISQTPVIIEYLSKNLKGGVLHPKTVQGEIDNSVIIHGVQDCLMESSVATHPFNINGTWDEQKDRAGPWIDLYLSNRLPKWLTFFETMLTRGEKPADYFVEDKLTASDIAVFLLVEGHKVAFAKWFAENEKRFPAVMKLFERVQQRPNIKKWLESDLRYKHHPEVPNF